MLKGKSVVSKSILSRADGERLGEVKDLIVSKDHANIIALIVEEGGLFSKVRVVPISKVTSFGKDAIMVTDKTAVVAADTEPAIKESLDTKDSLVGKKVFTDRGDEQAHVTDVEFDETSGRVVGLELGGGVLRNSPGGTAYLAFEDIVSIGQDAVVIRAESLPGLLAQATGTPDAARRAPDTA